MRRRYLLLILWGLRASFLWARFQPLDAEAIDREERLSSEYYNDILSYRYARPWSLWWEAKDVGFRANYGSLDVRRFYYQQDIKFLYLPRQKPGFSFEQRREESADFQHVSQIIRLQFPLFQELYSAILAEGDTFKKFGDLGLAVSLGLPRDPLFCELYYWSVDHYYQTKEEVKGDTYLSKPYSGGGRMRYEWQPGYRLSLEFEQDAPLVWQRKSQGYEYSYQRQAGKLLWQAPLSHASWSWGLSFGEELKGEKKAWLFQQDGLRLPPGSYAYKALQRSQREVELEVFNQPADNEDPYYTASLWFLRRKAAYSHSAGDEQASMKAGESSSHDAQRREWGLLFLHALPRQTGGFWQWGLTYNRLQLEDENSLSKGELKVQTAIDIAFSAQVHTLINFTWDVDEVYRHWGQRFRPWGGGNLQFLAVF